MENGDIAIPFACCFVMKRIENFDPIRCEVSVLMTMIMRIKFTDIEKFIGPTDVAKVKDFTEKELKARVHEEEGPVMNGDTRSGTIREAKSMHSKGEADMLTYTMRVREMFTCNFHEYRMYPFDQLNFTYKFELSHFELPNVDGEKIAYRFDHYIDDMDQISWKPDCDYLPEFDMDYLHSYTSNLSENKPVKYKNNKETKMKAYYYPGFEFKIKAVRDPMNKMVKSFFPCFLLGLFHLCSF